MERGLGFNIWPSQSPSFCVYYPFTFETNYQIMLLYQFKGIFVAIRTVIYHIAVRRIIVHKYTADNKLTYYIIYRHLDAQMRSMPNKGARLYDMGNKMSLVIHCELSDIRCLIFESFKNYRMTHNDHTPYDA